MKNLYVEELKFIANLALEFRLSLKNICKYFNVEASEGNQLLFYDEIIKSLKDAKTIQKFKYLVYETTFESEKQAEKAYNLSKIFYLKYLKVKKQNICGEATMEDLKKCLSDLRSTDIKFKKMIEDGMISLMSEEVAVIIAKYRIKHVISKEDFSKKYNIKYDSITKLESKITNPSLKNKVSLLNEHQTQLHINSFKKRVKK